MSDNYYCRLDSETEETEMSAPLGCEAAEKYARMKWDLSGRNVPLEKVDLKVVVRKVNGGSINFKKEITFNVKAQVKTFLLAEEVR